MKSIKKTLVFTISFLLTFILTEGAVRFFTGKPLGIDSNFLLERHARQPLNLFVFDRHLGWSNNKSIRSFYFKEQVFGFFTSRHFFKISLDPLGYRLSPNSWDITLEDNKKPLLALGDSFTFGDEVSDEETWPSHLQAIQKIKVVNGGVNSYGLDQIFLKLQKDVSLVNPAAVVISVMSNTLKRTTITHKISSSLCYAREKPVFLKKGDVLVLKERKLEEEKKNLTLNWLQSFLGHSVIFDTFFRNWFPRFWSCSTPYDSYPSHFRTNQQFGEVSCSILRDLAVFAQKKNIKLFLLGQAYWNSPDGPYKQDLDLKLFFDCASQQGIAALNLDNLLSSIFYSNPDQYKTLFFPQGHMTNQGNIWVAQELSRLIGEHMQIPATEFSF